MLGIIFSNIYDSSLGELTSHRTVASVPFGGRYRQIDFVLSDMVNSGINTIGVITKYNYRSLMDHLGSCQEWDLNRKNGGLFFLPPFISGNTGIYRGKLEALNVAMPFLEACHEDYVVMSDCTTLCNIDYRKVLDFHKKGKFDITVVANRDHSNNFEGDMIMRAEPDGNVTEIALHYHTDQSTYLGLGMFIMRRLDLIEVVRECAARGMYYLESDYIQRYFNEKRIRVGLYRFDGVTLRNHSIPSYFRNNMRLRESEVRNGLFLPEAPIYTKVRDEIPTFYGHNAAALDCIVADGCHIHGTVEDSVLFRDVTIARNAHVKNSIIMQSCTVGEGARLENVILDKNVEVSPGTVLIGSAENPVIIGKGETA